MHYMTTSFTFHILGVLIGEQTWWLHLEQETHSSDPHLDALALHSPELALVTNSLPVIYIFDGNSTTYPLEYVCISPCR
jgi:hypothetical protein